MVVSEADPDLLADIFKISKTNKRVQVADEC